MVISARKSLEERHRTPSSSESVGDDKELSQAPPTVAPKQTIDFVQSPAERLEFLENDSVDLVIAGMSSHQLPDPTLGTRLLSGMHAIAQACHWFDWSKVWPEVGRVLRKGGSAAFWVRPLPCYRTVHRPTRPLCNPTCLYPYPELL